MVWCVDVVVDVVLCLICIRTMLLFTLPSVGYLSRLFMLSKCCFIKICFIKAILLFSLFIFVTLKRFDKPNLDIKWQLNFDTKYSLKCKVNGRQRVWWANRIYRIWMARFSERKKRFHDASQTVWLTLICLNSMDLDNIRLTMIDVYFIPFSKCSRVQCKFGWWSLYFDSIIVLLWWHKKHCEHIKFQTSIENAKTKSVQRREKSKRPKNDLIFQRFC